MTIIQPNKNRSPWNKVIIGTAVILFGTIATCISLCSKAESFRFEAQKIEKEIDQAELVNADLKGKVMKIVDLDAMKTLALEKGLVEDKNPQWVFASR